MREKRQREAGWQRTREREKIRKREGGEIEEDDKSKRRCRDSNEYREEVTSKQPDNEDRRDSEGAGDVNIKGHINSENRDLGMTEADKCVRKRQNRMTSHRYKRKRWGFSPEEERKIHYNTKYFFKLCPSEHAIRHLTAGGRVGSKINNKNTSYYYISNYLIGN